jgi:hypothetical protein
VELEITSTDDGDPLVEDQPVLFALHDTFGSPPFRLVMVKEGIATLKLFSYGSFTVGAFTDWGKTELELDLATLEDVSDYFKTH